MSDKLRLRLWLRARLESLHVIQNSEEASPSFQLLSVRGQAAVLSCRGKEMTKAALNQQDIVLVLVLEKMGGKFQTTWGHFEAVVSRLNLSVIQGDALSQEL
jgi:hypothetical protein